MSALERNTEIRLLDRAVYDLSRRYTHLRNIQTGAGIAGVTSLITGLYEYNQQDMSGYPWMIGACIALLGGYCADTMKKNVKLQKFNNEVKLENLEINKRSDTHIRHTYPLLNLSTYKIINDERIADTSESGGGWYNQPFKSSEFEKVV